MKFTRSITRKKSKMFPLTLEELRERLKSLDEVSLLELLNINSEDLVKAFSDYIEDNFESLINEVDWEEE
jgi:hypothetical protein